MSAHEACLERQHRMLRRASRYYLVLTIVLTVIVGGVAYEHGQGVGYDQARLNQQQIQDRIEACSLDPQRC